MPGYCALMKQGLRISVDKYKRDKISKEEKKQAVEDAIQLQEQRHEQPEDVLLDDSQMLFRQDGVYERNIVKVLLEYGLKPWNEEMSIADHIFHELEQFHFENPQLEQLMEFTDKCTCRDLNPMPNLSSTVKMRVIVYW